MPPVINPSTSLTDDGTQDIMELLDHDVDADSDNQDGTGDVAHTAGTDEETHAAVAAELTPEIEDEIRRALVPEEVVTPDLTSPKAAKSHLIPLDLIQRPLRIEDLWDEGSI